MKNYKKISLLFWVVVVAFFGFWLIKSQGPEIAVQNQKNGQDYKATLVINDGKTQQKFDISEFVGKSALEATVAKAEVATTGEGKNAFITGINGVAANSQKREFWELNANGLQTQTGAGTYIIQNNDYIEWKISTY